MIKKIFYAFGVLISVLVIAFVVLGLYIPKEKEFTQVTEINATPEQVWAVLKDRESYSAWQPQIEKIDIKNESEWTEHVPGGTIDFRIDSEDKPRSMDISYNIGDSFKGTWKGQLSPRGGKTLLRTTDKTVVNSWLTKVPMWFFFDIEDFATDWNKQLKERVESIGDQQ